MTIEDKLRFELDEGFTRIPAKEIDKLSKTYDKIYDRLVDEYGYDGDRPYYDSITEFCYMLRELYSNDEDFIQTVLALCNYDTYGWALDNVRDKEIYEYAKKKIIDKMKHEDELDDDEIRDELAYKELPA